MNSAQLSDFGANVLALAVAAAVLFGYYVYLGWQTRRDPTFSVRAVAQLARASWVEYIMSRPGQEVLAIQTLRNSTMAATFLASTAVLLMIGVLTLTQYADRLAEAWGALSPVAATSREVLLIKLLCLLADLFFVFFCFSVAIRLMNQIGFMIAVPEALRHPGASPRVVARHLNRAGDFYARGMRGYYFLIPLVFWLFGALFLVVSSVGLVLVLYWLDRGPKIGQSEEIPD
jgi:uncharacterized membrane protein